MPVGEAWEIVDRANAQSVVKNGPLAGKTLHELMESAGKDIIGSHFIPEMRFPLLIKLIDTAACLSIQVHPDKSFCKEKQDGSEEKSEMWYILRVQENAILYAGLNQHLEKDTFRTMIEHHDDLQASLKKFQVAPGEVFYIKSGRIHAIGGGILLYEVQNNSDTTFRVWDWNRVDANGKSRTLHVQQALSCIDFDFDQDATIPYPAGDQYHLFTEQIQDCPFNLAKITVSKSVQDSTSSDGISSNFHILTAADASAVITYADGCLQIKPGQSCLIPAATGDYTINALPDNSPVTILKATAVYSNS